MNKYEGEKLPRIYISYWHIAPYKVPTEVRKYLQNVRLQICLQRFWQFIKDFTCRELLPLLRISDNSCNCTFAHLDKCLIAHAAVDKLILCQSAVPCMQHHCNAIVQTLYKCIFGFQFKVLCLSAWNSHCTRAPQPTVSEVINLSKKWKILDSPSTSRALKSSRARFPGSNFLEIDICEILL